MAASNSAPHGGRWTLIDEEGNIQGSDSDIGSASSSDCVAVEEDAVSYRPKRTNSRSSSTANSMSGSPPRNQIDPCTDHAENVPSSSSWLGGFWTNGRSPANSRSRLNDSAENEPLPPALQQEKDTIDTESLESIEVLSMPSDSHSDTENCARNLPEKTSVTFDSLGAVGGAWNRHGDVVQAMSSTNAISPIEEGLSPSSRVEDLASSSNSSQLDFLVVDHPGPRNSAVGDGEAVANDSPRGAVGGNAADEDQDQMERSIGIAGPLPIMSHGHLPLSSVSVDNIPRGVEAGDSPRRAQSEGCIPQQSDGSGVGTPIMTQRWPTEDGGFLLVQQFRGDGEPAMSRSSSFSDLSSSFSYPGGVRRRIPTNSTSSLQRQSSETSSSEASHYNSDTSNDALPANMTVSGIKPGIRQYLHRRDETLNSKLTLATMIVITAAMALVLGHYIGSMQATSHHLGIEAGQVWRLRSLQDQLVTCLDKTKSLLKGAKVATGSSQAKPTNPTDSQPTAPLPDLPLDATQQSASCETCKLQPETRYSEFCNTHCKHGDDGKGVDAPLSSGHDTSNNLLLLNSKGETSDVVTDKMLLDDHATIQAQSEALVVNRAIELSADENGGSSSGHDIPNSLQLVNPKGETSDVVNVDGGVMDETFLKDHATVKTHGEPDVQGVDRTNQSSPDDNAEADVDMLPDLDEGVARHVGPDSLGKELLLEQNHDVDAEGDDIEIEIVQEISDPELRHEDASVYEEDYSSNEEKETEIKEKSEFQGQEEEGSIDLGEEDFLEDDQGELEFLEEGEEELLKQGEEKFPDYSSSSMEDEDFGSQEETPDDGDFVGTLSSKLSDSWFILRNFTTDLVGSAANLSVNNFTTQLKENVETLRHQIQDAVSSLQKSNITSHLKDNVNSIGGHLKDAVSNIKDGNFSRTVKDTMEGIGGKVKDAVSGIKESNITSQIKEGLHGLGETIQGAVSSVKQKGIQLKKPFKKTMKAVRNLMKGKPINGGKEVDEDQPVHEDHVEPQKQRSRRSKIRKPHRKSPDQAAKLKSDKREEAKKTRKEERKKNIAHQKDTKQKTERKKNKRENNKDNAKLKSDKRKEAKKTRKEGRKKNNAHHKDTNQKTERKKNKRENNEDKFQLNQYAEDQKKKSSNNNLNEKEENNGKTNIHEKKPQQNKVNQHIDRDDQEKNMKMNDKKMMNDNTNEKKYVSNKAQQNEENWKPRHKQSKYLSVPSRKTHGVLNSEINREMKETVYLKDQPGEIEHGEESVINKDRGYLKESPKDDNFDEKRHGEKRNRGSKEGSNHHDHYRKHSHRQERNDHSGRRPDQKRGNDHQAKEDDARRRFEDIEWEDIFQSFDVRCFGVRDCLRKQREAAVKLYEELLNYQDWLTERSYKKHLEELKDFMEELEEFLAEPFLTDADLEELMEDFEDMAEDIEEATTKNFWKFMKAWTPRQPEGDKSNSKENSRRDSKKKKPSKENKEKTLTVTLDLKQAFNFSETVSDDVPESKNYRRHAGYGYHSNDDWFIRRMQDRENSRTKKDHEETSGNRPSEPNWYDHWMQGREDGRTGMTVWDLYQWFSKRQALRHEWRIHEMDDESNWFLRRP